MTFFTETVGITVTRVQHYFNPANQLIDSFDYVAGTTSFYYDGNGNLVEQLPPGAYISHWYTYNQRNLLTSQGRSQLAENTTIASFSYDGTGNRLTQTDHTTPGGPTTTTYTNDIQGLSQVLVADDGSSQTTHLFGLDLISQQSLTETRTLLTDGLGSVRTEMVGSAIETLTTYKPFGMVIAQTGSSGTTYGFTGEQFDSTTGLLYLRARYYNPGLHSFMARDPWPGTMRQPATLHGFSYVGNNPINYVDPTGFRIEDEDTVLKNTWHESAETGLFNYQIISKPSSSSKGPLGYVQVNYQSQPWSEYKTSSAPNHPVLIPIRHPLNLEDVFPNCDTSLEVAKEIYSSGAITAWEVTARNVVVEMKGTILNQKEWALRDAIGIAYVPYNRMKYNNLPDGERLYPYEGYNFGSYEKRKDVLGYLLSGEFAVSSNENWAYTTGLNPGEAYEEVYHFALVVAYGVHNRYFIDTSYGATGYFHRPYNPKNPEHTPQWGHCQVTGEYYDYVFFRNQHFELYNLRDRAFISGELVAQGGWPAWVSDGSWHADEWITGFPPAGCDY